MDRNRESELLSKIDKDNITEIYVFYLFMLDKALLQRSGVDINYLDESDFQERLKEYRFKANMVFNSFYFSITKDYLKKFTTALDNKILIYQDDVRNCMSEYIKKVTDIKNDMSEHIKQTNEAIEQYKKLTNFWRKVGEHVIGAFAFALLLTLIYIIIMLQKGETFFQILQFK